MDVGEFARLDLEPVVPITPPHPLQEIARQGQGSRFPLPEHVAVLVQHQPGILEEVLSATA